MTPDPDLSPSVWGFRARERRVLGAKSCRVPRLQEWFWKPLQGLECTSARSLFLAYHLGRTCVPQLTLGRGVAEESKTVW